MLELQPFLWIAATGGKTDFVYQNSQLQTWSGVYNSAILYMQFYILLKTSTLLAYNTQKNVKQDNTGSKFL